MYMSSATGSPWSMLRQIVWCYSTITYTLPQKKRNFNFPIFRGDPGPGSVTPGHMHQGKFGMGFLTNGYQEQCTNENWPKVHWPTLLPKRKATSEKSILAGTWALKSWTPSISNILLIIHWQILLCSTTLSFSGATWPRGFTVVWILKVHVEEGGMTVYHFKLKTEKIIYCKNVTWLVTDGLCPY